jgi:hypothetical protein
VVNSVSESWTGIGVVAAGVTCTLMIYWPRFQLVDSTS